MTPRTLWRAALGTLVAALFVALQFAGLAAASAQGGTVSISTDKSQYQVGDTVNVCYSVAAAGPFTIFDIQANGNSRVFFAGVDDGTGGCLPGTVTPPTGTECLIISDLGGSAGSAQTCFQVLGQSPQPPSNQQCGTVSVLNGHVTSTDAFSVESCFAQSYQYCSPATLEYDDHGIDSGTRYSFSLQSNGSACGIAEVVQRYTLPISGTPPILGSCVGLTQTQFGLLFTSCQGGENVLVPLG
jgi:hypothetical protein